jgi:hypothetical protein
VVHAGRLGIVDHRSRAARHAAGEIVLLDPYLRHALVPAGRTAREHPYERTHGPVRDPDDQFMFLCFDVMRPALRARFVGRRRAPPRGGAPPRVADAAARRMLQNRALHRRPLGLTGFHSREKREVA